MKELTEQLQKLTKSPKSAKTVICDQQAEEDRVAEKETRREEVKEDSKPEIKHALSKTQELDQVDLLALAPENFNELQHLTKINQKKEVMELFNTEL